jgi:hypothetical protein
MAMWRSVRGAKCPLGQKSQYYNIRLYVRSESPDFSFSVHVCPLFSTNLRNEKTWEIFHTAILYLITRFIYLGRFEWKLYKEGGQYRRRVFSRYFFISKKLKLVGVRMTTFANIFGFYNEFHNMFE